MCILSFPVCMVRAVESRTFFLVMDIIHNGMILDALFGLFQHRTNSCLAYLALLVLIILAVTATVAL